MPALGSSVNNKMRSVLATPRPLIPPRLLSPKTLSDSGLRESTAAGQERTSSMKQTLQKDRSRHFRRIAERMEMGMDWNALELKICEAARKAFDDLKKAHAEEQFYVYALYTDGDATTVLGSANSVLGFEKTVSQQSDMSTSTLTYYKW